MAKDPEVKFGGDASGLKRAAKEAGQALGDVEGSAEKASKSTSKFGDSLGAMAKDKLGPFGDIAEKAGLDLDKVQNSSLVAGAAIAGFATFVAGGVAKLSELTAAVKHYKAAGDLSADTASRLNAVFHDFGLEVDDGVDAIKTLAEEAGDAPEKFERFGVAIKRTTDGSVDMVQLLADTADRFRAIKDPTERAAMGANLFGDNWLRIAPLLEKGGANLKQLTKDVDSSRIASDELIDQQTEMEVATRKLHAAVDTLQIALAKDVIPELTDLANVLSFTTGKVTDAKNAFGGFGDKALKFINPISQLAQGQKIWNHYLGETAKSVDASTIATAGLTAAVEQAANPVADLADAEEDAAEATRILAERTDDAIESAKEMAKAADDQRKKADALRDSTYGVVDSVVAASDANKNLTEKTDALREARELVAAGGDDQIKNEQDYKAAVDDVRDAAIQNAKAQADQAEQLAKAADMTFTAEQKNIVYRDSLAGVRDATDDPALKAALDNLIALYDNVASQAANAARQADYLAAAASRASAIAVGAISEVNGAIVTSADAAERRLSNLTPRAVGGSVTAGGGYLVGEQGPEPFVPAVNGRVLSVQQAQQALAGDGQPVMRAAGQTTVINVTVNAPVGSSPRDIGRTIQRALNQYSRAGG